jgi:DNA polymerase-1
MAAKQPTHIHLIDGHVFIFRAYFSMPEMRAPDKRPTQAAYGFTNMLLRHWREKQPTHMAVCFDHAMESFRNEIEPGYKAQRDEPDDELEVQFEMCRRAAIAIGMPVYEMPNYEADDVIATLATQMLAKPGTKVSIYTTDKDLAQLVREDGRSELADFGKDDVMDADGVRAKFGVDPDQIPDYLGLVGDTVDNLPGVPGVGAKTAGAALRAFGQIQHIPADPKEWLDLQIRGSKRAAGLIDEHRERALLTKELATVHRKVPGIKAGLRDLELRGAHADKVDDLFGELGWGRILDRIPHFRA